MDYKEKYLNLKKYVLDNNQHGSGNLNPLFINNFSNLAFVVGNNVLGDDAHAVIASLIEEFNKIAALDLKHNPEISQYYSVGNGLTSKNGTLICENCEIVLKYADATVCVTNGKAESGNKNNVDCHVSRGSIRFYIKQKEGDVYKYTKIRVVNVQKMNSLQPHFDNMYQNTEEFDNLGDAGAIALSRGQTEAILSTSKSGKLNVTNPDELSNTTRVVNDIVTESKNAVVESQLDKMNTQRILSAVPSQNAVNAANTVANTIMNTNVAKSTGLTTVMIPNNEPIPLSVNNSVNVVPATISSDGIITKAVGGTNTMNSTIINNRSSLAIDAKLAVVPTDAVIDNKNIDIIPNNSSLSAVSNKLIAASKDFYNKTGDLIGDIFDKANKTLSDTANKVGDIFVKKPELSIQNNSTSAKATVVPVSQNMSVLTSLPKEKAIVNVPIPQNDAVSVTNNQQINSKRFENKFTNLYQTAGLSINQTNKNYNTVKNGNTSIKRTEESSIPTKNLSIETSVSNRTITKPKQVVHNSKNAEANKRKRNIY